MTPVLHHESPRAPGSLDGHPLPQYGEPGDVCATPGCGSVLSAYNERDVCNLCWAASRWGGKRKRRAPASADGPAVTTAAPEPAA